jgi:hypothetical protein
MPDTPNGEDFSDIQALVANAQIQQDPEMPQDAKDLVDSLMPSSDGLKPK